MSPLSKLIGGAIAFVVVVAAGAYAYHMLRSADARTPEGYALLTAMPDAGSFEPTALPAEPVLTGQAAHDLAVNFGYKVGTTAYSYSLALTFPGGGDAGRATLTARHVGQDMSVDANIRRRWDEPRKAYAIAFEDKFDMQPSVPALCIKAVIGPQTNSYDLKDASLCVAQRDAGGACHPETLACGLIR